MLVIVQIWDAQKQELAGRVGATSRRSASKIAEVLHDRKTFADARAIPLYLRKRTCAVQLGMSALGH
jgi:hypothetical protein